MKKYKGLVLVIICILIVMCLSGCWNRREMITFSILMGIGVDKAEEQDKLQLTAQVVKASELKRDGGGGGEEAEAHLNVRTTGDTVFDTLRNFTKENVRKIYLSHSQVLIFGEDIAVQGVQKYTDFFVRDHEPRLRLSVLVARGRAEDILDVKSKLEKIPAVGISSLLDAQSSTSEAMEVTLKDFICCLMSNTKSPTAPLIERVGEGDEETLRIAGMAIFKKDKYIGELIGEEARGLLWVLGEVKSGIINIYCPDEETKMGLEIIQASSKVTPEIKGDKVSIKVEIKEEGHIGDQECLTEMTPSIISEIEQKKAEAIRDEVIAALEKAQELNSDIFGFGEAVHRKFPKEWKEMESKWDYIFPELEVDIKVETKVRRSGMLIRSTIP